VDVVPVPLGHINESWFVLCPQEEYVLQRVNRSVLTDPDGMTSNIVAVRRHLDTELLPVPVATPDGRWLLARGPDLWRAYRRVPGAAASPTVTTTVAGECGTLLGRLHGQLADVDPSQLTVTLPRFHDLRRRLEELRYAADDDPFGRAGAARGEVEAAMAAARLVDVAEDLGDRVPVRTAHFDAKLDNFLFRGDRAVCLVDLDTVMPGAWFWDVGDLLRSAATTAAEDSPDPSGVTVEPPLYDAVVAGYRSSVPPGLLTPAESSAIDIAGAISTYEQALRFLTDWLAGDVYFRTIRPGQNLDRARAQLALLSTMPVPVP
jgi:Ser/Thr protein kinase RdoA (MazF antagonist)